MPEVSSEPMLRLLLFSVILAVAFACTCPPRTTNEVCWFDWMVYAEILQKNSSEDDSEIVYVVRAGLVFKDKYGVPYPMATITTSSNFTDDCAVDWLEGTTNHQQITQITQINEEHTTPFTEESECECEC
uniref:NTR domain-containing protein n=1 Tax=Steinernema glaseri TaxID=37863 RepID=A0A1I7Y6E1_9BILA